MKKTRFQQLQEQLLRRFGPEEGRRLAECMDREFQTLCEDYAQGPQALIPHTHKNIFPAAAAFRAMQEAGMERGEAANLVRDSFQALMEESACMIRRLLKVPGLYRLMPWIWKTMVPKMFGEAVGFKFQFYPTGSRRVKFDMLECPYYRICGELDCLELASIFCTTDDICYGNMHPKLLWNRTKTLARGGDRCDFDVMVKK